LKILSLNWTIDFLHWNKNYYYTCLCNQFEKILCSFCRWRGSVYKLIWRELLAYLFFYYLINFTYRYVLNEHQRLWVSRIFPELNDKSYKFHSLWGSRRLKKFQIEKEMFQIKMYPRTLILGWRHISLLNSFSYSITIIPSHNFNSAIVSEKMQEAYCGLKATRGMKHSIII